LRDKKGRSIKVLRSGKRKEYVSNVFKKFCEDEGLDKKAIVYTPQKNGVFKRKDLGAMGMTTSILSEKEVSKEFQSEVVNTVFNMLNKCPTKFVWNIPSFEAQSGGKPLVNHLKFFGMFAMLNSSQTKENKFRRIKCELHLYWL